jgi:hypothetical protein
LLNLRNKVMSIRTNFQILLNKLDYDLVHEAKTKYSQQFAKAMSQELESNGIRGNKKTKTR